MHSKSKNALYLRQASHRKAQSKREEYDYGEINRIVKAARGVWFSVLALSVLMGVILLSVVDSDFYVSGKNTILPIVNAEVSTSQFFVLSSILYSILYTYFCVNLVRLWGAIQNAPVRTRGNLDLRNLDPWVLSDFALWLRFHGSYRWGNLQGLSIFFVSALTFVAPPALLALFWMRYWPSHDQIGSSIIGAALALSIFSAVHCLSSAFQRLLLVRSRDSRMVHMFLSATIIPVFASISIVGLVKTSGDITENLQVLGIRPLSEFLPAWTKDDHSIASVDLRGMNFLTELDIDLIDEETAEAEFRARWCSLQPDPARTCSILASIRREESVRYSGPSPDTCKELELNPNHSCKHEFDIIREKFSEAWEEYRRRTLSNAASIDLRRADFRKADLRGAVMSGLDLSNSKFDFADLSDARFERANFNSAVFNGTKIDGANFSSARFEETKFTDLASSQVNFSQATFQKCRFNGFSVERSNLSHMKVGNCFGTDVSFTENYMLGASFSGTGLRDGEVRLNNLDFSHFRGLSLSKMRFSGNSLDQSNANGLELYRVTGKIRFLDDSSADLSVLSSKLRLTLREQDLDEANFALSRLDRSDFRGASGTLVFAQNSNFHASSFQGSWISLSDFSFSKFQRADLTLANLSKNSFSGVNFSGAHLDFVDFSDSDLRNSVGLLQSQLDTAVGNEGTILPSGLAPDTGKQFSISSCINLKYADDFARELNAHGAMASSFTLEQWKARLCRRDDERKVGIVLGSDDRLPKNHPLIELYEAVDEYLPEALRIGP